MDAKLKMALIGATGGTGSAILRHALSRGHRVHALVRSPEKLAALFDGGKLPDGLAAMKGDATSESDVAHLIGDAKPDVLAFAVGTSSLERNTICFDTAVAIVRAACKRHYTSGDKTRLRVITVSGGGLGAKPGFVMEKVLVPLLLKEPLFDALQMEAALHTAPTEVMDTLVVRPYRLTDGAATDYFSVVEEDYAAPILLRYTTRADVAQCVVREAESWTHGGKIINVFTGGA
jgi:NAD(P)-dependent dehydrogenase (short-subunit alcohol dehydrogenase family)